MASCLSFFHTELPSVDVDGASSTLRSRGESLGSHERVATKADKPGLCPALAPVVANPFDAGLDLTVVLQPLDLNGGERGGEEVEYKFLHMSVRKNLTSAMPSA